MVSLPQTQANRPNPPARKPVEDFDRNTAQVLGRVQSVWSRYEHTFLRLAVPEAAASPLSQTVSAGAAEGAEVEVPGPQRVQFLTARIENGLLHGELVTVMPGDWVLVTGYLADMPYEESIREFLDNVRFPRAQIQSKTFPGGRLVDEFPNCEDWDKVRVKRVNTRLEALDLKTLHGPNSPREAVNTAEVEGIVAATWRWGGDLYARLAIYDCHTAIISGSGKNGHPRRKPHYVTVVFPEGNVSGRKVDLHERLRIRVRGAIQMRLYSETLREMLLRSAKIGLLLDAIPNADLIGQYRASRSATYVAASSAQVFGKLTGKQPAAGFSS